MNKALISTALLMFVSVSSLNAQEVRVGAHPSAFIENAGQFPDEVEFMTQVDGAVVYFCRNRVVSILIRPPRPVESAFVFREELNPRPARTLALTTTFVGGGVGSRLEGERRLDYYTNYFKGKEAEGWRSRVPAFESLVYRNLYPGIDARYTLVDGRLKSDFIVWPGASISELVFRYSGAESFLITPAGDVHLSTRLGPVLECAPILYQDINGQRRTVRGKYERRGTDRVGFVLEENIDATRQLIIDPVLVHSTFLGGAGRDRPKGIAVDSLGYVYVAGWTQSADFPVKDAIDDVLSAFDIFISKLDPTKSGSEALICSTYLGGASLDGCSGIAVDPVGDVYITGWTSSLDFPTVNPFDSDYNGGGKDVIVAKLSSACDQLLYSTYMGGNKIDMLEGSNGIAVDRFGDAYITGHTQSEDFPTRNGYDPTFNEGYLLGGDVFLAQLAPHLGGDSSLKYSTFFGDKSSDYGKGIALDEDGHVYVCGYTTSELFPRVNAAPSNLQGWEDAFVAKFLPSEGGTESLLFSTLIGGSLPDLCYAVTARGDDVYIAGGTFSENYPLVNAYNGSEYGRDVFVSKFSKLPSGKYVLTFSSYLSGQGHMDTARAIAVDDRDHIYLTGETYSRDFPVTPDAYATTYQGLPWSDVFLVKLAPNIGGRGSLLYGTYLGGAGEDRGFSLTLDANRNIYLTGWTLSPGFPTVSSYDDSHNSPGDSWNGPLEDGFLAVFKPDLNRQTTIQPYD